MSEPVDIFLATGNGHKLVEMQALAHDSNLSFRLRTRKTWAACPR